MGHDPKKCKCCKDEERHRKNSFEQRFSDLEDGFSDMEKRIHKIEEYLAERKITDAVSRMVI